MIDEIGVDEILLAMFSISRARRCEIFNVLECYALYVRSVFGFIDLVSGGWVALVDVLIFHGGLVGFSGALG